ncbi:helix-turn-helix transcriptional regulator [Curtobacterium ammoniigenes]|uniref:helix-turn-helix transcriptional regulator n=1 Tax=Curtobacterium ammoniigenes TaxID=395387 RepID=UPI000833E77D|nr:helix-turn-helix transcriptional regulator [Curtobacterium ammoniigenes]
MRRPGVQLQVGLAVLAVAATLAFGGSGPFAGLVAGASCVSAVCWGLRAFVATRIPRRVDVLLLGVVLLGSAFAAIPTAAVAAQPMAGSLFIVVGDATLPRWTRWVWPTLAAVASAAGGLVGGSVLALGVVAAVLVLAVLAGYSRRRANVVRRRALERLREQHAVELEQVRAGLARVLTPDRLRERFPSVTRREADVLALIARGQSNDEIARNLFVSVPTVKSHVNALFAKLSARDRAHAVALVLGAADPVREAGQHSPG